MSKSYVLKPFYIKLFSIILISCLGIIVYSNTFHCSFHLDDEPSIIDNFAITNIHHLQSIWDFWPCRFITYLSIAFNYHFNRLDVFGYHLFNLLVHLVSAILVWWLVLLTLSAPAMKDNKITQHAHLIALLAGLVFVSHPVQTQGVTYIIQRAASMATLFYVASLCFYVKSRSTSGRKGRPYYILSLIAAIMAMFTKETAITLPLMILLYEFSFLKTKKSLDWKYLAPVLCTLLIIPLTMVLTKSVNFQELKRVGEGPASLSSIQYFLTQLRVMVTYIRLVFLPLNQNLDYDYPVSNSLFELPTLFSFLFLIIVLFWAQRLFLRYRLVSFSIFWFFLTLLPESSLLPIEDVIFEHRLYLPLVGFSMFLVSGVYYLWGKNTIKTMVIALTLIIACNSVLTYQRNKVWKNEIALWDDTVRKSPHKARAYTNRGWAYYNRGNLTGAMSDYNKAIEITNRYAIPYNDRGLMYDKQGELAKAMSDYNMAVELDPGYAKAYNNRGSIYSKQNNPAQAMSNYNKAIEINPNFAEAYYNRGFINSKQNNFVQAMLDYNKAIEINPLYAEAYNNRGTVYDQQNNFTQAVSDYSKAIEMSPRYAEAYNNRGLIYEKQGNLTQAMSDYDKAIKLNPKYAKAYNNRGNDYYHRGKFTQAMSDYNKAIELNPKLAQAHYNRGNDYYQLGKFTQAMSDYAMAIEITPNYAEVYYNRANVYAQQGNITGALSDYNKAIEINPKFEQAYNNRGLIDDKQGNITGALSDYNKAIEINPNYKEALYNRAVIYFRLKKYDRAWTDVNKIGELGGAVNPALINALKQASGKR